MLKNYQMKSFKNIKVLLPCLIPVFMYSCTKLNTPVYSSVPSSEFWQTSDQFLAGVAPIYTALQSTSQWDPLELNEESADEIIIPTRGNDWLDNGNHQRIYLHTWTANDGPVNSAWTAAFTGISNCNYIMNVIRKLPSIPSGVDTTDYIAQLRIMRAYYYEMALDMFGNVPIVSSFDIDPSTVKNNTQKEVFNFIESELLASIPNANPNVDLTTYGKANKWVGFAVLAKLYLNAQVYTGTARWADCAKACDSIILSGKYSLMSSYFDNFKPQNDNSTENILVVPYDKNYITGNARENATLHYNDIAPFGLLSGMYNGWCSHGDFYYGNYDTTSTYTVTNGKSYRTFNDQRTGQFLVGQQYSDLYFYPPDKNILVLSHESDSLFDNKTPLVYEPNFNTLVYSTSQEEGRLVGARSVKYFPEAGTQANMSNDAVLFRLADFILMRAECIMRGAPAGSTGTAVQLVNQIRDRAYGNAGHDWTAADITPANMLAERAREMAWEGWRRQDLIRFDVADNTNLFGGAKGGTRSPAKPADADTHLRLFPIPDAQHTSNGNLVQNPGYPAF